jgi:hypothetical protein
MHEKRNVNLNVAHGPKEPVAFLLAWMELGEHLVVGQHMVRNIVVPPERVAFHVAALGDKANALLDLLPK